MNKLLAATFIILLNRRTFYSTKRAIHTAITFFRTNYISAIFTLIKILTCIAGHFFLLLMIADRACNRTLHFNLNLCHLMDLISSRTHAMVAANSFLVMISATVFIMSTATSAFGLTGYSFMVKSFCIMVTLFVSYSNVA